MKFGFTLIEIVVVIIIIGIMATIAITHYGSAGEQTYDRMAQADLKLIRAAERVYRMENVVYYITTPPWPAGSLNSTQNINWSLKLALPIGNTSKWNYHTQAVGVNCCAQATRNVPGGRTWRIRIGGLTDEEEPPEAAASRTCP